MDAEYRHMRYTDTDINDTKTDKNDSRPKGLLLFLCKHIVVDWR